MPLIDATLLACAPNIAPTTLIDVIRVESGGDPLQLNVNGLHVQPPRARNVSEATRTAERFVALGYSVDLGLMQVNSRNLAVLGLTVPQVFDPCTNVHAGAAILAGDYAEASHRLGPGQPALLAALSAYNTGDFRRGFANGYVARYGPAIVPALSGARADTPQAPPNPYSAGTSIYLGEAIHVRID
jgi:type IV secretion system protein VirB1